MQREKARRVSPKPITSTASPSLTFSQYNINKMSDYEDEMDIDAPSGSNSVTFSSDNTNSKGKRSAANLPVEAEDSLPWLVIQIPLSLNINLYLTQGRKISSKYP